MIDLDALLLKDITHPRKNSNIKIAVSNDMEEIKQAVFNTEVLQCCCRKGGSCVGGK